MESSGIKAVIGFILAAAGVAYLYDRNKRHERYEQLQAEVRDHDNRITEKRSGVDYLEKKVLPARQAQNAAAEFDIPKIEAEIAALRDEVTTMNNSLGEATQRFEAELEEKRKAGRTEIFPNLSLKNGETLSGARISKFGTGFVSIEHDGGIRRVVAEDLPDELISRFRLDYIPSGIDNDLANQVKDKTEGIVPGTGEVKTKADLLYERELQISVQIRQLLSEANGLQQEGFRSAITQGLTGSAAAAHRRKFFQKADSLRKLAEGKRVEYRKLRQERLGLQQESVEKANRNKPRQN